MEWECLEITVKRLKMADFSDYKMIQDFLSASSSLLPMWVTNKRMEVLKTPDKVSLKFIEVLLEFRQFWLLTEFETTYKTTAFPATLQNMQQSSYSSQNKYQKTLNENRALAEGIAPSNFNQGRKVVNNFKDACSRHKFRTFVRKSECTARLLKDFVNSEWPAKDDMQRISDPSPSLAQTSSETFITSVGFTSLAAKLGHPLISLAASEVIPPEVPTFVQAGAGTCPFDSYGSMIFPALLSK